MSKLPIKFYSSIFNLNFRYKIKAKSLCAILSRNVFLLIMACSSSYLLEPLSHVRALSHLRQTCGKSVSTHPPIFSLLPHNSTIIAISNSTSKYRFIHQVICSRAESTHFTESSEKKKKMEETPFNPDKRRADFLHLLRSRRSSEGLSFSPQLIKVPVQCLQLCIFYTSMQ